MQPANSDGIIEENTDLPTIHQGSSELRSPLENDLSISSLFAIKPAEDRDTPIRTISKKTDGDDAQALKYTIKHISGEQMSSPKYRRGAAFGNDRRSIELSPADTLTNTGTTANDSLIKQHSPEKAKWNMLKSKLKGIRTMQLRRRDSSIKKVTPNGNTPIGNTPVGNTPIWNNTIEASPAANTIN